ncbi:MAG: tetratricopeptide repeat protein [Candidatus Sulfotelmatobacter sp.]
MLRVISAVFLLAAFSFAQQPAPTPPPVPGSPEDLVQQGQKLSRDGKQDEALALYRQALEKSPRLFQAHLASGVALDLKGDYSQAREHFSKAIELAGPDTQVQALRAMAVSYAFEGNGKGAEKYEKQVIDMAISLGKWTNAAEISNEVARIFLESGNPGGAYKWYKRGFETTSRNSDMTDADKNLWLFRWESAQGRVAARRGNADEAQQHVAAAKVALDKANNPDQMRFFPYLAGYVAYYTGDTKTAIADLQKADQHDPLILVLLGEAYEKSGDAGQAKDYYRKVLEINTHNPTNAFARPLARKKLE